MGCLHGVFDVDRLHGGTGCQVEQRQAG
jgi:hypothetical protein